MGNAQPLDAPCLALLLEPRQVLFPGNEVVHLFDLNAAKPTELVLELRTPLLDRAGPDLRRDDRLGATLRERCAERLFGSAVHR